MITFEELKSKCREIIQQISPEERISVDNNTLDLLSSKLESEFNIEKFKLEYAILYKKETIVYSFISEGIICKSGFTYEPESFDDKLSKAILDIVDSEEALALINNNLDSSRQAESLEIKYIYGKGTHSSIYYWDYNKIVIGLSEKALNGILEQYRNNNESYKLFVDSNKLNEEISGLTIIDIVKSFNSLSLNQKFQIELETSDLETELVKEAISIKDVIDYITEHKSFDMSITTVEVVRQLGVFIVLVKWEYEASTNKTTPKIVGEKIIDIENNEIIYNYSILSRIEQSIKQMIKSETE